MCDAATHAHTVTDDVLVLVFKVLAAECSDAAAAQKTVAARFTWFRSTLPLVCKHWHRLVLNTPTLWTSCIIDPAAESHHVRRSCKTHEARGLSPRMNSGASTPVRGASPLLGSSPDSDAGYWSSHYAPYHAVPGSSPPHALVRQHLTRISLSRHSRCQLSADAVIKWLQGHPAAAAGIQHLVLDLNRLSSHDFERRQLQQLLQVLPQVQQVHMVGAVEGTDAYEPLGHVRQLRELDLSSASIACLDGGLMALGFLPCLQHLSVSLDIPPATPASLTDLPTGLVSLKLCAMWLQQLPQQITDLKGLTSIELARCQVEVNPLPLLLTLPCLAVITVRAASRGISEQSLPMLLPMQQAQHQQHPGQQQHAYSLGRFRHPAEVATAGAGLVNTSITSLELVDVGLHQLPSCVSKLVALQNLNLALNQEMGLNPSHCLPAELTCITGLQGLCLGHCGLSQLPVIMASLTCLTRLELQGNALSVSGFGIDSSDVGFRHSLKVLDLGYQGSGRTGRMRGIPAWVGSCYALRELRLGCSCLGYSSSPRREVISNSIALYSTGVAAYADAATFGQYSRTDSNSNNSGNHAAAVGGYGGNSSRAQSLQTAGSNGSSEGISLQQLVQLLPHLKVLYIEGGVWEQRAVKDALQLMKQLVSQRSRLQVVLPT